MSAKYSVHQYPVSTLLAFVRAGQMVVPEMQRPFVWDSTKVRDLLDSLYNGYPVGYLITWQSVGAALKGGHASGFQQILIDGQQRITALRAALVGEPVINQRYQKVRIAIGFNPVTQEFQTATPVIRKDRQWIPDVAELFNATSNLTFVRKYLEQNPEADAEAVESNIVRLAAISNAQIGIINLADDLPIETVSEIFVRINSKGVPLSSADFAMSKIATYGERGRNIRKLIDYFCNLAVAPHIYDDIVANDEDFVASPFLSKIAWLRHESEDLFDPSYGDLLRVASLAGFHRARLALLVSELSGRDPETRKVDESRIEPAYDQLERALLRIVNQHNFQQFLMTIKSAGFIEPSMILSGNSLNFAYALYLLLRENRSVTEAECKNITRRWFVMSVLTGRSSGSFESQWQQDMRRIDEIGAEEHLRHVEQAELSDAFWSVTLPANLQTATIRSSGFTAFLASQVKNNARGFLSAAITVKAMTEQRGDIHHIVPKDYLVKHGVNDRADYNQVANYVLTETPINIRIGNRQPADYMSEVLAQLATRKRTLGEITNRDDLAANFKENAIPESVLKTDAANYQDFLLERRRLMAEYIRDYYASLS